MALNLFVDIVFQSGEFYNPEGSFLSDFLINIIGALIGTGTALLVFEITRRDERRKAASNDEKLINQKLSYFSSMIENTKGIVSSYCENLKEFNQGFDKNFIFIPKLSTVPLGDLKRLAEIQDHEDYYYAYLNKFGYSKETVKEYRTFFTTVDFMYNQILAAHTTLTKAIEFDYARKVDYKNLVTKAMDTSAVLFNSARNAGNIREFETMLDKTLRDFYAKDQVDYYDLNYYQEHFVEPVRIAAVKKFKQITEAVDLATLLKEATTKFSEIKDTNAALLQTLTTGTERLCQAAEKLKITSERLGNEFSIK